MVVNEVVPTAAAGCNSVDVKFVHERSTKNTERFSEVVEEGQSPFVGTLYLRKDKHRGIGSPLAITVTIRASVTA